jgi:hypothetical protein
LRKATSTAPCNGLGTTIKYLLGATGNDLGTTIKNLRQAASGDAVNALDDTIKYLRRYTIKYLQHHGHRF